MGEDKKTFLPWRSFLESCWIIPEKYSITKIKLITGKNKAVLVSIATMPKVMPKDIAPVSPIKNLAGLILNHKKANKLPTIIPQKVAKSYLPKIKAMAHKVPKEVNKTPPAKPSKPSVSLTEKEVATKIKMKIGIYHQPTAKLPKKGICKTS